MKLFYLLSLILFLMLGCNKSPSSISFSSFGIEPETKENASIAAKKMIEHLKVRQDTGHILVTFPKGRYDFFPDSAFTREYYISNHDQDNPKKAGIVLEGLKNITIDGQGSELIFHGRMIPFALVKSENITLKNFSVDFEIPALRQLNILKVNRDSDIVIAEIYPGGNHRIQGNKLFACGEGYENPLYTAMPFRADRRLAYRRQDVSFNPAAIIEKTPDTLIISGWGQTSLTSPGERFALRSYHRPTPGIFVSECTNTTLKNITVHYSEGMGLLAQMSENITLDGFSVCLKGDNDPRYFTTQADATHFSACKGVIISKNGLYEGMADDAINVHGTYLQITKRINDSTLQACYMHPQAWGFKWGEPGDSVQFVESNKMELAGEHRNSIKLIRAIDKPTEFGAKEFEIIFTGNLPLEISGEGSYGVENLSWTPEVIFSNNTIRNNRARGALFSTPKRVVCENNLFDHTHGTAILLCGDCNGWFETGACREVIIRNNRFVNALTAYYQFTNAVISIYPEIPNLKEQQKFFHSGIVIENNIFETFDRPIVYAKSTDGLAFRNNTIRKNSDFEPFHWNEYPFFFERVNNVVIKNNQFEDGTDLVKDIRTELSSPDAVLLINNN
ncbi:MULTISPECIES: right-handed parallel beta-helix repeat-containing protein [unclassified Proteiniphilum]|uniref:right-handed parallel beta-helix repeat-containing protein n=1 Tax=unclassified Proteiniphilum TaxID=2622718 RepID=UPI00257C6C7D|nr:MULTISPECIES: right-handed parallel beta-helix repeat-containing protein [unclassified Proteiniphilum]